MNVSLSNNKEILSLAVNLYLLCCASTLYLPPPDKADFFNSGNLVTNGNLAAKFLIIDEYNEDTFILVSMINNLMNILILI